MKTSIGNATDWSAIIPLRLIRATRKIKECMTPRLVSEPIQMEHGGHGFFYVCRNCFTEVSNTSEDSISLSERNQACQHKARTV